MIPIHTHRRFQGSNLGFGINKSGVGIKIVADNEIKLARSIAAQLAMSNRTVQIDKGEATHSVSGPAHLNGISFARFRNPDNPVRLVAIIGRGVNRKTMKRQPERNGGFRNSSFFVA